MAALIALCFKEVKEFCLTFKFPNASLSLKFILKITGLTIEIRGNLK